MHTERYRLARRMIGVAHRMELLHAQDHIPLIAFALLRASVLASCNTVEGVGQDVQAASKTVEETAQETNDDTQTRRKAGGFSSRVIGARDKSDCILSRGQRLSSAT